MTAEATPAWLPQTPEQEIEAAEVLATHMFEAFGKYVSTRADEIQARVLQGGPIFEPPEPPR